MGFAELGQVLLQNNLNLKRRLRHANLKPLQSGLPAYTDYHDRDSLSASKFERRIKAADRRRCLSIAEDPPTPSRRAQRPLAPENAPHGLRSLS